MISFPQCVLSRAGHPCGRRFYLHSNGESVDDVHAQHSASIYASSPWPCSSKRPRRVAYIAATPRTVTAEAEKQLYASSCTFFTSLAGVVVHCDLKRLVHCWGHILQERSISLTKHNGYMDEHIRVPLSRSPAAGRVTDSDSNHELICGTSRKSINSLARISSLDVTCSCTGLLSSSSSPIEILLAAKTDSRPSLGLYLPMSHRSLPLIRSEASHACAVRTEKNSILR